MRVKTELEFIRRACESKGLDYGKVLRWESDHLNAPSYFKVIFVPGYAEPIEIRRSTAWRVV